MSATTDLADEIARLARDISGPMADRIIANLHEFGVHDDLGEQQVRATCYAEAVRVVCEKVGISATVTYPKGWL